MRYGYCGSHYYWASVTLLEYIYIMAFIEKYWVKLKQNIAALLYLCVIQTWWNFKFPAFIRLGTPWNILVSTGLSIACILIYFSIFVYPEKYAPSFNLEYLNEAPISWNLKQIHRMLFFLLMHSAFFYMWYMDFYHMPSLYYLFWYVHCAIVFIIIAHSIQEYNHEQNKDRTKQTLN
jgi:hypothetical protein